MHTGGGDTLKSAIFAHLGHPCPDLDLGSGHTAYRHVALIDIEFGSNLKNFLWTDIETGFIRLT